MNIKQKTKLKKIFKVAIGNDNNLFLKINLSLFMTGTIFALLALVFQSSQSPELYQTLTMLSGFIYGTWIIIAQENETVWGFIGELYRFIVFFFVLLFSLYYFIAIFTYTSGVKLIILTLLSSLGILLSCLYLISKFIDVLMLFKKVINQIQNYLFGQNGTERKISTLQSFLEKLTSFLVSISAFALAIKTIIEPLVKLF